MQNSSTVFVRCYASWTPDERQTLKTMKFIVALKNPYLLEIFSLCASPTVSVELKLPVELNSFSDASRVCDSLRSGSSANKRMKAHS